MRVSIFAYSKQGCRTAQVVADCFPGSCTQLFAVERLTESGFHPIPKPSQHFYGEQFSKADVLIFVGSCGIAVREIAPHVKSKVTDPAVLVIDELGTYVIPLLSGHIGGGNQMARQVAEHLNATAVITTATDINGKFSLDTWATEHGYVICDMKLAKKVSAAILERDVPLCCDLPVVSRLPNGMVAGASGELGIYLGWERKQPFHETLRLIPRVLHLGIGCRRGTEASAIRDTVESVLHDNRIDVAAISCVASIDLKSEEQGLLEFCREQDWPVLFYSAEQLQTANGCVSQSEFVAKITGVDNVCERAALMGAETLIVKKTARNGVTVAVAAEPVGVCFE